MKKWELSTTYNVLGFIWWVSSILWMFLLLDKTNTSTNIILMAVAILYWVAADIVKLLAEIKEKLNERK